MTIMDFLTIVSYTIAVFMAGVTYGKEHTKK